MPAFFFAQSAKDAFAGFDGRCALGTCRPRTGFLMVVVLMPGKCAWPHVFDKPSNGDSASHWYPIEQGSNSKNTTTDRSSFVRLFDRKNRPTPGVRRGPGTERCVVTSFVRLTVRGCSRRLQRLASDFGLEHSFETASARLREHHGLQLSESTARAITLKHAAAMCKSARAASAGRRGDHSVQTAGCVGRLLS